jgi:AAA domain
LDQFLEHLIAVGIEKIIRIGGHSSSRALEGKNLRLVSQTEGKTGSERHLVGRSHAHLEEQEAIVKSKLRILSCLQKTSWESFHTHLRRRYPLIYSQFSRIDGEGFARVGNVEPFDLWTTGKGENLEKLNAPLGSLNNILWTGNRNVYQLAIADRTTLLDHWVQEVHGNIIAETFNEIQEDDRLRQLIADVHDEVDRRVLETADVIGVTTSGLAKRISVLRHVNAEVVICEEAGEVLEAHMLSALIPSVQHLIQIGDHQQLRPQINNYNLSLESQQGGLYQLDRSQFERLSSGESGKFPLPIAQLNVQRRMRPEISILIRTTLYKRLVDHRDTKSLPDVVGMRKNVFWFDHTNQEDRSRPEETQRSKSNVWEVDMTHALVRHIVRQGAYSSNDIAVLTPYVGQLQKLRAAMRQEFEIVLGERDQDTLVKDGFVDEDPSTGVDSSQAAGLVLQKKAMTELLRIGTVDNFQGEEAKIVIVSLVRSNSEKKVGFLKTTNRINVLLSRAQHGMYLIGNAETYSNVPMWSQVLGMLRAEESVGGAFELCCPRHPETEILVSNPDGFAILSPDGGCRKPCDR